MTPEKVCSDNCQKISEMIPGFNYNACMEECPPCANLPGPLGNESFSDEFGVETMCEDICIKSEEIGSQMACQSNCPSTWCDRYTNAFKIVDESSLSDESIALISCCMVGLLIVLAVFIFVCYLRNRQTLRLANPVQETGRRGYQQQQPTQGVVYAQNLSLV